MEHLPRERLEAGLDHIRDAPRDNGRIVLVVRRPDVDARELLAEGMLDQVNGLAGDNWLTRGSSSTPDGSAHPHKQITVMNARVAELVSAGTERMPLAGDQLFVDFDLSVANLPAGSLLAVGQAVLEVSEEPHLGCAKFVARFGAEAMRFVNSRLGRQLRMRGMNTRVVRPGIVRPGDAVTKVTAQLAPPGQVGAVWRPESRAPRSVTAITPAANTADAHSAPPVSPGGRAGQIHGVPQVPASAVSVTSR
jgi:MOSC domain-containing protein YiiM